jgi:hypothetical protein
VASAKKDRGRQLLEQRLSSYQMNPGFLDTVCDGVLAVRRIEERLRQLDDFARAANAVPEDTNHDFSG